MLVCEQFLFDGEGAPIKLLGFVPIPLLIFKRRQIVQIDGDLVMFRPLLALENRQRAPVQWFRFVILTHPVQESSKRCHIRFRLGNRCAQQRWFRLIITAFAQFCGALER